MRIHKKERNESNAAKLLIYEQKKNWLRTLMSWRTNVTTHEHPLWAGSPAPPGETERVLVVVAHGEPSTGRFPWDRDAHVAASRWAKAHGFSVYLCFAGSRSWMSYRTSLLAGACFPHRKFTGVDAQESNSASAVLIPVVTLATALALTAEFILKSTRRPHGRTEPNGILDHGRTMQGS